MRIAHLLILCLLALLLGSSAAKAVIIASDDGTGNVGVPNEPGTDHVGTYSGESGVYVGNGWMIVARHSSVDDVELDGVVYRAIDSSRTTVDPVGNADLSMVRIESDPGLNDLAISTAPPSGDLLLVGHGRNRGAPLNWDPDPSDDGWYWGTGSELRWGTNEVSGTSIPIDTGLQTITFAMDFSGTNATAHEAVAAVGDSGGGVFPDDGSGELAGIMLAVATFAGQPASSALFGNVTYAAQLSDYRTQILDIRANTACSNGIDDDGDGAVDYPDDGGCQSASDAFERLDTLPCDDGFDADGDGAVDYPEDVGCFSPSGWIEDPACSDGIDNDGDGQIDWDGGAWINGGVALGPADTVCTSPTKNREKQIKACGLGFELALGLPLWFGLRRKLRRRG